MATVFAGSEDRVANRSRIVSKLQLYDLPLSLPTQFLQLKISIQDRIVKQFQLYDLLLCFQTQFSHLKVCIQDRIVKLEDLKGNNISIPFLELQLYDSVLDAHC